MKKANKKQNEITWNKSKQNNVKEKREKPRSKTERHLKFWTKNI